MRIQWQYLENVERVMMVVLRQEMETTTVGTDRAVRPVTIMRHVYGAFPPFAMLAAIKLDVFTPLEGNSMKAGDLQENFGIWRIMATQWYSCQDEYMERASGGRP